MFKKNKVAEYKYIYMYNEIIYACVFNKDDDDADDDDNQLIRICIIIFGPAINFYRTK